MAYTPKLNWNLDNIVQPADMNRIEQGIKDAHDAVSVGGKFATPITLTATGGASGSVSFDGTADVSLPLTISPTGHTHANATTSVAGLMSGADKTKLDGIAIGATKTTIINTLTSTATTDALSAAQGKALKDLVDGKANTSHTHTIANVTDLQTALNGKANTDHTQTVSTITGLQTALDGKASSNHVHSVVVGSSGGSGGTAGFISPQDKEKLDTIQAGAGAPVEILDVLTSTKIASALSANQGRVLKGLVDGKASTSHTHTTSNITDLSTVLGGYSPSNHNHNSLYAPISHTQAISTVTGLQGELDNKASINHSHTLVSGTANGFMSSGDKTKLDGIATGATNTIIVDGLTSTSSSSALSANQGRVLNTNVSNAVLAIDGKASKDVASTIANGLMSSSDKSKLDGISTGATNTVVSNLLTNTSTTDALSAAQGKTLKDLVDGKASTSHGHNNATTSVAGFMSSSDKSKLDGLSNTTVIDTLTSTSTTAALSANQGRIMKTNVDNAVLAIDGKAEKTVATTSANGLMASSDKVKLNGIEVGATKTTLTSVYDGASSSIALSQYGGRSLFEDLKLRGYIRHTVYSGTQYIKQWIETTGARTSNTSVLSNGQSLAITLSTGGYMPTDTIFLSSTLTNYYGLYLDNMVRTGGYTISARVINISGGNFNNLERCEWNIIYSYQRS